MRRVLGKNINFGRAAAPKLDKEPCLKTWPIHCHILDYEPSTLTLPQLLIRGDDYTVFCPTLYDVEIFALSLPVQTFINISVNKKIEKAPICITWAYRIQF